MTTTTATLLKSIAVWKNLRINNPKDVSTTEFEKSTSAVDKDNADTDTAKRWPRRAAALKARARGKAWTTYEITHD